MPPHKLLRRKLKLYLVIAGDAGSKHFTVAGLSQIPCSCRPRSRSDRLVLIERPGWSLIDDLPFAGLQRMQNKKGRGLNVDNDEQQLPVDRKQGLWFG